MAEKKPEAKAAKPRQARPTTTTAIVMHEVQLSPRQTGIVQQETPQALIKTKPGRGGKRVTYVEGGYVISKLNEVFSPLGWEFKVTERGETERKNEKSAEGEVWVYGELTIIDHKKGYRTTKGQYGQHPIHANVPIGDAYKAAATDALKKCASLIGIALDVYWGQLDREEDQKPTPPSKDELVERAKMMINSSRDIGALLTYREKLVAGKTFTEAQKKDLLAVVDARCNALDANDEEKHKA